MNSETLVNAVKEGIGTGPNYPSGVIEHYIGEVKAYLAAAGVPETIMNSDEITGIIVRGVDDLWNHGCLSEYFYQRVIQLSFPGGK